jgi:hypothetical protein
MTDFGYENLRIKASGPIVAYSRIESNKIVVAIMRFRND